MSINRPRLACFVLLSLLIVTGCSGPRPPEVTQWAQAISAAQDQSDTAFTMVNTLVKEQQIAYAATQPKINEELFHPGLAGPDIRAWQAALDALAVYAQSVAKLADPDTYAGTGASAAALGQAVANHAHLDVFQQRSGLADAITKIGDAITNAAARSAAQEIMRRANPGVQDLLSHMSMMLAQPKDGVEIGVIATVTSNWNLHLANTQTSFLAPGADKQAIARQYAGELTSRDESIDTLRSLKSSLEQLAQNHAQLAYGRPADTAAVIAQIQTYTQLARAVLEDLKKQPASAH